MWVGGGATAVRLADMHYIYCLPAEASPSASVPNEQRVKLQAHSFQRLRSELIAEMSLTELANEILRQSKILDEYIASEKFATPSLDMNGPLEFPITKSTPKNIKLARVSLLEATDKLHSLATGPAAMLVLPAIQVSVLSILYP